MPTTPTAHLGPRKRRVPVNIRRTIFIPPGFAAWVPFRGTLLVRRGVTLTPAFLAHELAHILQAEDHSWPAAYIAQWVSNRFVYTTMPFEVAARAASTDHWYLAWARDLLAA